MLVNKPVVREFTYRGNRLQLAMLLVLAVCGVPILGYLAMHVDQGTDIKGIELTTAQFRLLLGGLAVCGLFASALMGFALYSSFQHEGRVALTRDSVILPKPNRLGIPIDEIELPLARIRAVQVVPFIGKTLVLQIIHDEGILSVPSNMFPNRRDFDTFGELVRGALAND